MFLRVTLTKTVRTVPTLWLHRPHPGPVRSSGSGVFFIGRTEVRSQVHQVWCYSWCMPFTKRRSITLDADDLDTLEKIGYQGSPEAVALHAVTGIVFGREPSEQERIHALLVAARKTIEERTLEEAYGRQATYEESHPDVQVWRKAMDGSHLCAFMDSEGAA